MYDHPDAMLGNLQNYTSNHLVDSLIPECAVGMPSGIFLQLSFSNDFVRQLLCPGIPTLFSRIDIFRRGFTQPQFRPHSLHQFNSGVKQVQPWAKQTFFAVCREIGRNIVYCVR